MTVTGTVVLVLSIGGALLRLLRSPRRPSPPPRLPAARPEAERDASTPPEPTVREGRVRLLDRSVTVRTHERFGEPSNVVAWELSRTTRTLERTSQRRRPFDGDRLRLKETESTGHRERMDRGGCIFLVVTDGGDTVMVDARGDFVLLAEEEHLGTEMAVLGRAGAAVESAELLLARDRRQRVDSRHELEHAWYGATIAPEDRVRVSGVLCDPRPDDVRPLPVLTGPGLRIEHLPGKPRDAR